MEVSLIPHWLLSHTDPTASNHENSLKRGHSIVAIRARPPWSWVQPPLAGQPMLLVHSLPSEETRAEMPYDAAFVPQTCRSSVEEG